MRRPLALLLATLLLMVGIAAPAAAVGTGDVYTTSDTVCDATHPCRAPIEWRTSVYGPVSGTSIPRRTMFTVYAQAGEQILLGSSSVGWDAADAVVWNPGQVTDTMVSAVPAINHGVNGFSCQAQRTANPGSPTLGQLRTRSQELAGPRSASGTANLSGYVPCVYTAPVTGLYRVGFYGTAGGSSDAEAGAMLPVDPTSGTNPTGLFPMFVTPTPTGNIRTSTSVAAWDVTVRPADTTSVTDLEGRVFTMAYAAFAGDNPRAVTMQYYLTTLDGFRYHVDTKGFDPNGFVVYGNQVGFLDADGTPLNRDVLGNGTRPQALESIVGGAQLAHPIYPLSFEPLAAETLAALSVPVAPATPSVSALSFSGSKQGQTAYVSQGGTFTFTTSAPGTVQIVISPAGNTDPGLPTNRSLRSVVTTAGVHTITWDGLDNSRDPVPVGANYRVAVELRVGEYHAPMLDVESSVNGGPSITLENPPGLLCPFTGVASTGTNCTTAFYDDRGYTTSNNVDVGTPGGALCPSFEGAVPAIRSTGLTGFDSTSTQRAFGSSTKFNANALCPATGGTLGDAKGLDLWTYFPSNEATTFVDIVGIPAAPTAVDDSATTPANTPLQVVAPGVLGNDTGTDLTVLSVTAAGHGTVVRSDDGSYLYTPTTGYSGPDQFTYTVTDSADQTATATVRITVTPTALDDSGSTSVGTPLVSPTSVLANDVGSSLTASLVTSPAHGSVVVAANGTYTYTPVADFSGSDEFTYRASDGTSSVIRTVRLTVTPLAADDSSTTAVDTAVTIPSATGVLANDAGTLTVDSFTQPGNGSVSVDPDGAYTYTPDAGFSGLDTFTYTATDGATPLTRTVTITVTPTAAADAGTTPVDTVLTVDAADGVLANDAGSLTVDSFTQPGHGTVSVDPDGAYEYTPSSGFSGVDTFTYTAIDGTTTLTRTVTITVTPTAAVDAGSTPVDTVLTVDAADGVLANDAGTLAVDSFTQPGHGTVSVDPDGSYEYTPDASFSGVDTFTYTATDGNTPLTRTVTITVTPTATDDATATTVDVPVTVPAASGVLVNDAGSLTVDSATQPGHGTVSVDPDGAYTYTPDAGFSGVDSFTYTATDGTTSLTRTVSVTVTPTAADDTVATSVDVPAVVPASSGLLVNDAGSLTVDSATQPSHGSVAVDPDGAYTYTPDAGFSGTDSFTYTVTDGTTTLTRTVTVSVTPTAADDAGTTPVDTVLVVDAAGGVLANDAGSLTVDSFTQPSHGSVAVDPDGAYTYTPDAGFSGVDTFTYTTTDGVSPVTRTVTLTVTPTAANDSVATTVDVPVSVPASSGLLANDAGSLTVDSATQPSHGSVAVDPDGAYTYTPDAGYSGTDSFTYTVTDGTTTLTRTVSVSVTPTAADDAGTTPVGTPLTVGAPGGLLSNDAGSLTVDSFTQPSHGSVAVDPDGAYTYTPDAGFSGTDTFTYTVSDGVNPVTRTVTITVTPTAADDTVATTVDVPVSVPASSGLLANDAGSLTVTGSSVPAHGTVVVNADGSYTYTPAAGFSGTDSFTYTVTDGTTTLTRTVTVSVTPTAADDAASTPAGAVLTVDAAHGLLANDAGSLTVVSYTQPGHGTVVVQPDGSYTYTPDAGFAGVDEFTYTVEDAAGNQVTRVARITVAALATADPGTGTTPAAGDQDGALATTGADVARGLGLGLVLLVVGFGLVLLRRRREA